jgi:hypothetical protein
MSVYSIEEIQKVYKKYGYDMPAKAIYKRSPDRIYFSDDFKDGEEIELYCYCEKPSSNANGNVWYERKKGEWKIDLVNIKEIIALK